MGIHSNGMTVRRTLRGFVLCSVMGVIVGCGSGDAGLSVPTQEFTGGVESSAQTYEVSSVVARDGEVCAFTDTDGERVLLVFPPGAAGQEDPLGVVVGDHVLREGDVFESTPVSPLSEGAHCGGEHYEAASVLTGEVMPVPAGGAT